MWDAFAGATGARTVVRLLEAKEVEIGVPIVGIAWMDAGKFDVDVGLVEFPSGAPGIAVVASPSGATPTCDGVCFVCLPKDGKIDTYAAKGGKFSHAPCGSTPLDEIMKGVGKGYAEMERDVFKALSDSGAKGAELAGTYREIREKEWPGITQAEDEL
jgi:hypothetical protein